MAFLVVSILTIYLLNLKSLGSLLSHKQHILLFGQKSELTDIVKPLLNQNISEDTTLLGGLYVHIIHPFDIQAILEANKHCKLLPVVKQKAFNPKDLQQINSCLSSILREKYKVTFLLHQESKSVAFNNDRMNVSHLVKKKFTCYCPEQDQYTRKNSISMFFSKSCQLYSRIRN